MRGLRGKVVVVTGGGGGIGTAACQRFAEEGAKVAVFDINGDAAKRAAAQITAAGGRAEAFACDITDYAGCKAGLIGFSKTLAREHARHNISVNVVCPGIVNTQLYADYKKGARNPEKLDDAFRRAIPLGRLGEPADLPGIICFLASDDAAYITGQVISVSGGLTMAG